MGWWLASPIRKLFQNPDKILKPFIQPGMRVLEPGSAMGFFTLPAATLAGPQGKIICVDIQTGMLDRLKKRAHKAGLTARIETRLNSSESLEINDLKEKVDFAFAIAMVHEVPGQENFFKELAGALKPGAKFLFAEPRGHVTKQAFQQSLFYAQKHGLELLEQGQAYGGWNAILKKPDINAYLGRQN
jgi:ubiquinone/menaquinone biosynthesis C-methylase UbiE